MVGAHLGLHPGPLPGIFVLHHIWYIVKRDGHEGDRREDVRNCRLSARQRDVVLRLKLGRLPAGNFCAPHRAKRTFADQASATTGIGPIFATSFSRAAAVAMRRPLSKNMGPRPASVITPFEHIDPPVGRAARPASSESAQPLRPSSARTGRSDGWAAPYSRSRGRRRPALRSDLPIIGRSCDNGPVHSGHRNMAILR